MKKKMDPKEWTEDFKLFMDGAEVAPPQQVRNKIFNFVHQDLNPSLWLVLAKLGGIHAVVGSFSLSICSQFGMGKGDTVMQVFMSHGAFTCMAFCGALFLGLTTFVAGFVLSVSEIKKIRATAYAPIVLLGTLSLLLFLFFGAEIALNLALAWFFGALLTGILITELNLLVRHWQLSGQLKSN